MSLMPFLERTESKFWKILDLEKKNRKLSHSGADLAVWVGCNGTQWPRLNVVYICISMTYLIHILHLPPSEQSVEYSTGEGRKSQWVHREFGPPWGHYHYCILFELPFFSLSFCFVFVSVSCHLQIVPLFASRYLFIYL